MSRRLVATKGASRLDRFLAEELDLSRQQIRELLRLGHVTLQGRAMGPSDKGRPVPAGSELEVLVAPETLQELRPDPSIEWHVLAEGEDWIALDKAPGLPVHPLRSDEQHTLLNALVHHRPRVVGVGEAGLRSGVVHRLDVDTSGVQLFALGIPRWQRLRRAFTEHRVDKVYRALVQGRLVGEGEVDLDLRVARHRPARVEVGEGSEARRCGLRWRALEPFADATLLELRPRTGFLHQIRVSCAHLGHPLLGDSTYAPPDVASRASRHLLHASSLTVDDVAAHSEDPADFRSCLERLRES